jgi:hypothetical protein
MNLKFFSQKSLDELREKISSNRVAYLNDGVRAVCNGISPENIMLSRAVVDDPPKLTLPEGDNKHDDENARKIYNWLSKLTPVQASDPRLWAYLTHTVYADYVSRRWPISEDHDVEELIKQRYFVVGQGLEPLSRNAIARLWWGGYLTYDQNRVDPFELTDVLLSLQDFQQAFLERAIGRSKKILMTALEVWKERLNKDCNITGKTESIKAWAKLIRLHGAVVLLDSLPQDQLKRLLWVKLVTALGDEFSDFAETS